MAKSSRSSTRKANNQRLKANVFGPVESARAERLSAKLLEIAAQPKPSQDGDDMKVVEDVDAAVGEEADKAEGAEGKRYLENPPWHSRMRLRDREPNETCSRTNSRTPRSYNGSRLCQAIYLFVVVQEEPRLEEEKDEQDRFPQVQGQAHFQEGQELS